MAGLVPAIHVFIRGTRPQDVDARDKRGHDDGARGYRWSLTPETIRGAESDGQAILRRPRCVSPVMAGLVPAIHVFIRGTRPKAWMPATRAGMTTVREVTA